MFSKTKTNKNPAPQKSRNATQPAPSILSADLVITGDIKCEGDVQIDGTVEGDVRCARLTVGQSGTIRGSIVTDGALIRGMVSGEIRAAEVKMTRTSKVYGDVLHESLMIEPGALIEGNCRRLNSETAGQESTINLIVDQSKTA